MSLPTPIVASVTSFQAAVAAAGPAQAIPALQLAAILTQGQGVLALIDAAIQAAGRPLDAADPTGAPGNFGRALEALGDASVDETKLVELRGLLGRAIFNLSQASA